MAIQKKQDPELNSTTTTKPVPQGMSSEVAERTARGGFKTRWLAHLGSTRVRRLSREFIWIALGQTATVLGALVGVRILTGVLTPKAYGRLALGMTVATLITQSIFGPLANGATRFFAPAREAGAFTGYLRAVRSLLSWATGATVVVVSLLCLGLVAAGRLDAIGLTLAAIIFALLGGYNSVLNGMQNAARQRAIVALHQGVASWGRFLLAAALVLWFGATSSVAMLGYALAILLVLISQGWFFRRTVLSHEGRADSEGGTPGCCRGDILAYAWPFAVWGIPAWAQVASERWWLQVFGSAHDVGYYAVLYQIGYYPISFASRLLVQLLAPVLFQRAGDASDESRIEQAYVLTWRLVRFALGLTGLGFVLGLILHDAVFGVLVASEYAKVSHFLPWMLLAGGLFAAGQIASLNLMSSLQSRSLLVPKVLTSVFGVVLSCVGAAFFGIAGVVVASIVYGTAYVVWVLMIARAKQRKCVFSTNMGIGPSSS